MSDPTIADLSKSLNTKKKTIENTLYRLKKSGTELGYIKDGRKYFTSEDQEILIAALPKKSDTKEQELSEQVAYLKDTIAKLESNLQEERKKAEIERSEMRQLLAQANANLNQALDKNEQLQLEYNQEKNKGFFAKLFGK